MRHSEESIKLRRANQLLRSKARSFKGQIDYSNMNPTERGFEKSHLKAYLKGRKVFKYGTRPLYLELNGEKQRIGTEPLWHKVR